MGGGANMQLLSPVENAIVGVSSGLIEVSVLQPMLFFKNASQQGLKFTLRPSVVYRGVFASASNMGILTGMQVPLTGAISSVITGGENRRLTNAEMIGSGFLGGCVSGIACGPMELVMIQQQRFGGSLFGVPARIVSTMGVSSLFRSGTMACAREAIFTAGYLGVAPVLIRYMTENGWDHNTARLLGAVGAGTLASTLSHPIDTIKTCMQGDLERKTFGSVTETARTLWNNGGVMRFFNGYVWRAGRACIGVFLLNESNQFLSPLFFPHRFEKEA